MKRQLSCLSWTLFGSPLTFQFALEGGTGGRLQGFLPWPEFLLFCGADRRHLVSMEVFQGLHPGQSSTAVAEPIVDIPVPHGGQHLQDPGLASIPQEVAGEAFSRFFF